MLFVFTPLTDAARMYFITLNWTTCNCVWMQGLMAMMQDLSEDPVHPIQW